MKIGNWKIHFYNPFKKDSYEHIVGINAYKDWRHCFEIDVRFKVFERPHITVCAAYTKNKTEEYVVRFYTIASKSYRNWHGGLKWYSKSVSRHGIDEGRAGQG